MNELHQDKGPVAEQDLRTDRAVVGLLLDPSPVPWSTSELLLELGDETPDTLDSIDRLHRAGVLHRCGEYVFATRTARALGEVLG